jgi:MFS family permease
VNRRQLVLAVYVPTFLLAFAQGMIVPAMPLYAQTFVASVGLISISVAALGVGTMLADLPAGMMLERLGRRPMMLIGTAMVVASYVGLAQAHIFPELIAYRIIGGVGSAMWGLSRLAFVTDMVAVESRGRALAAFGGTNRIGTVVGPAAGGLIGGALGLHWTFAGAAVLALAGLIVAARYVPETRPAAPVSHTGRWRAMGRLARSHHRDLLGAGTAQVFAQMIRSGRQLIVPLYAATALGMDVAAVGLILSISAIIDVALFLPAGMLMDRVGRRFAAIPSFLVMGIGMALLPFTGNFITLLGATAVLGLGNGLGAGTMMTLGADLAPKEATGEFLGLWRLIGDAGQMSGPLAVGGIADLVGLSAAALILAGIGFLAAGTIYVFVEETLRPAAHPRSSTSTPTKAQR